MASEVDLQRGNNNHESLGRRDVKSKNGDDDDTSSVGTMEPRSKEWMLAIARGDYHAVSRLLREEPRLGRRKDFVTGYTGLHWSAKHGNEDLVKMLAGTYKSDVNAKTNAGCTALHIAAQQGHEEVFDLLIKTYGADSNLRDYSGKKPYQYLPRQGTSISSDTFRSEYSNKSPFDRGGLYSSLRNSLLKFTPSSSTSSFYQSYSSSSTTTCNPSPNHQEYHNNNQETSADAPVAAASSSSSPSEHLFLENHFDKRMRTLGKSFLRELRPSIRKRANTTAFGNQTT